MSGRGSSQQSATERGVADAWDFWLSQHDVSTPEIIQAAVKEAWTEWLDDSREAVLTALAVASRDGGVG